MSDILIPDQLSHRIYLQHDLTELNILIVNRFIELARLSIAHHGGFHVALSGGATPQALYRLLVSEPYKAQIPWEHIDLYQTDERFVPFDHDDNNFQMIQRQMRDAGVIRDCFRMDTSFNTPHDAALAYEKTLLQHLPINDAGSPKFDFILLGIGTDGHIASLFPGTNALSVIDRYVVDIFVPQLDVWRISLTFPVLNQARHIAVLIAGENKATVVENLFRNPPEISYPAHQLKTIDPIEWYIDSAAASRLAF